MTGTRSTSHQDILSKVYVVHGNNNLMENKIYTILEDSGLQPIKKDMAINWTGEGAPFVGRVIDVAFEHAQAVLVLLSGEERVRLRKELQKQQEVPYEMDFSPQSTLDQIFEAGYAFGKYPERTILLQINNIRPFSDIAGRDILTFTETKEDSLRLIDRLSSIGCSIDNKIHTQPTNRAPRNSLWKGAKTNPRRVFVIHGRNDHLKREVFKFLNMLNLSPISWGEAVSATKVRAPYTGKILDALLHEAQAVLVLLTGDDEALLNNSAVISAGSNENIYLPRPNVVFEAGMSFSNARLAERTILVQSGDVKIWNAIDGRHRVKLSDQIKHRWELANSLKSAGCSVQIPSDELLRRIGNFGL